MYDSFIHFFSFWEFSFAYFLILSKVQNVPIIQETIFEKIQLAKEEGLEQGKLNNQRTVMIRTLHSKFTDGNEEQVETLVEKIEEMKDFDTLDQWFDQILAAHFLQELAF